MKSKYTTPIGGGNAGADPNLIKNIQGSHFSIGEPGMGTGLTTNAATYIPHAVKGGANYEGSTAY